MMNSKYKILSRQDFDDALALLNSKELESDENKILCLDIMRFFIKQYPFPMYSYITFKDLVIGYRKTIMNQKLQQS